MAPGKIERVCRLAPLQHGVLFEALRAGGGEVYQVLLELSGEVRLPLLRQAWEQTLQRHPGLRSSFHYQGLDHPIQVTRYDTPLAWTVHDWRDRDEAARSQALRDFLASDRLDPFDLATAPLLRLAWIRATEKQSWLLWTFHSLLLDGWSTHRVLGDVFECYRRTCSGQADDRPAPRPYWEYVAWLQERGTRAAEDYWGRRLAGMSGPDRFGDLDDLDNSGGRSTHAEVAVAVSAATADGLRRLGRTRRVTLGTLVHAAWAVTLGRVARRDEVVFGGVVSGRNPDFAGVDDLVGLFINNLPIRAVLNAGQPLGEWLNGLQQQMIDMREFSHLPLASVRRAAGLPSEVPLFDSMVTFSNYPVRKEWNDAGTFQVADIKVLEAPPYPLAIVGFAEDGHLGLTLSYDQRRLSPLSAARLAGLMSAILEAIADRPDQPLGELPEWPYPPLYTAVSATGAPTQAPTTAVDAAMLNSVKAIWVDALELPANTELSADTNFFDAGGYSLLAIKLLSRVRTDFAVDLPIPEFFADPTVGGTARLIQQLLVGEGGAGQEPIGRQPRDKPLPASFAQERLWLVDQVNAAGANNLLVTALFRHDVDFTALRGAVRRLMARHEVLRTTFAVCDGAVVQIVLSNSEPPMRTADTSAEPDPQEAARQLLLADVARPFDLSTDAPFRVTAVRAGPEQVVLGICLHHICYDGWSAAVLTGDLAALYRSERDGVPDGLPELPVQYADFSVWQRARLAEPQSAAIADYWRKHLAGLPELLRLTTARPIGDSPSGVILRDLPDEMTAGIRRLSTEDSVTPYMIVLTALAALTAARSGREDVAFGSPVSDREHPDLDSLIGLFVNTQILRLRMENGATFRTALSGVRDVCLEALAHRGMPFGDIVKMVAPQRAADRSPLVQISYAFQNPSDRKLTFDGRPAEYFPVLAPVARFELTVEVYDWSDRMGCALTYDGGVYDRAFIEAFADDLLALLNVGVTDPDRVIEGTPAPQRLRAASLNRLRSLKMAGS